MRKSAQKKQGRLLSLALVAFCQETEVSLMLVLVLFAFRGSHYVDVSVAIAVLELNSSVNQSIKSVVFAHTYVFAWTVHCAALTADNVAGFSELTTKNFHTESFAM